MLLRITALLSHWKILALNHLNGFFDNQMKANPDKYNFITSERKDLVGD